MIYIWILVGGALPVINRFITPIKWPYKWVTGVVTLLIEVVTPLITGTGPTCNTVDGRTPAPVDMVNIPLFTWFYTSQVVVWDFSHQQYIPLEWALSPFKSGTLGISHLNRGSVIRGSWESQNPPGNFLTQDPRCHDLHVIMVYLPTFTMKINHSCR